MGAGLLPPTQPLLRENESLCPGWDFFPVSAGLCRSRGLGRSLGTAGSAGASRAKPVRAVPCQAALRKPRPRPPPDALTQPPAWWGAGGGLVPCFPQGGCRGPGLPHQPGWSLRALSCAGRWSGARVVRPPWSSLLHESGPGEVVITPLFGSAVAAAPSYAGRQLLRHLLSPLKL